MEQYIIKGGHPLVGEVEIGGAKNAALAILAAAVMTDETVLIDNLPDVNDINVLLDAIAGIGANVHRIDRHTVKINGQGIQNVDIEYDYIPGVSSFSGAASALCAEYTLPGVSQSVVITRQAGRTPVPSRESISSFAQHGATMVIFLSSGLMDKVQEELIAGGYDPETPAAIVYKATWPDEKKVSCTVGTIAETGRKENISNLALILVGNFLGDNYERSKLYHPGFTTAFREGDGTADGE